MPLAASTPRSRASASASTPASTRHAALPQYQPPAAPLNPAAQRAFANLLQQTHNLRRLQVHIKHAGDTLTDTAGAVNDRASEIRDKYERRKARGGDDPHETGQRAEEADAFDDKVGEVTAGLEGQMRAVIDGAAWVNRVHESMQDITQKVGSQAATQTQTSTQRSRRGGRAINDDEAEDAQAYPGVSEPTQSQADVQAPSQLLAKSLKHGKARWEAMTLTDRYAKNNDYVGFFRTVHDARHHGDEAPPVPHPNTWFADDEDITIAKADKRGRKGGRQQKQDSDGDDIEIASERISTKCPITLLPFREPLTSTKCPHSFEKSAIMEMIASSALHAAPAITSQSQSQGRRAPMGDKAVKCPVCDLLLTANDLAPDPVLLRKVKRLEAAAEREERGNQSDDEEDPRAQVTRGTQRRAPETLERSDLEGNASARKQRGTPKEHIRLKKERASGVVVPESQGQADGEESLFPEGTQTTTAGGATLVDLGEEDDDEEDEDQHADEEGSEDDEMEEA